MVDKCKLSQQSCTLLGAQNEEQGRRIDSTLTSANYRCFLCFSSNGEVSTGSSEEDDSLEGDDSGHLAGPEKRLSLQDDDMPGGALTAADSKTAVKRAELTVVENTDGNAEIDDDEEETEDSLKTLVKNAKEVSKSMVMDDKTGKISSKRDDQKTK